MGDAGKFVSTNFQLLHNSQLIHAFTIMHHAVLMHIQSLDSMKEA